MSNFSLRRQAAYAFLLFLLLVLLAPRAGHVGDAEFWVRWASYIFEHGLGNVYQLQDNTYNPFYHYVLWLFGVLMGSTAKINYYHYLIKGLVLIFDFAGAFWAASLVPERERRSGLALLLLFNIGYLYNTLIWGQIDAIYTFFAFGAVVLAVQQRATASMVCYLLALMTKTQAIMFLPPLLLLWAPLWWQRPWYLVRAVGATALVGLLVLAPFMWWSWENYAPRILDFNFHVINIFPIVTVNAFNVWYLLIPSTESTFVGDALPFAGLTYHLWGLLLFCAAAVLALLPLLLEVVARLRVRFAGGLAGPVPNMALAMLSVGLVPLAFAFFNTQMHERYWHATLLFMAAYGFLRRDYSVFALVSVAYFLNLEAVLKYLQLLNYEVLIFRPQFVASLFGLALGLALFKLYRLAAWRENWQRIRQGA